MNKNVNLLLRLGIIMGTLDKEVFINKLSKILEDKIGSDPEKAQKISEDLLASLQKMKDELTLDQIIQNMSEQKNDSSIDEKIDTLTKVIMELNETLKKQEKPLGNN